MDTHLLLYIVSAILVLAGLAGTLLPALPGLPLMFGGMLLAAWADGFSRISGWTIAVLALVTLLAIAADVLATLLGAKRAGASPRAMFGAAIGTLAGLFFGLPGLLAGPFVGAVAGELSIGRPWQQASKIGLATWVGLAIGAALKLALAFAMLAIFALALLLP